MLVSCGPETLPGAVQVTSGRKEKDNQMDPGIRSVPPIAIAP